MRLEAIEGPGLNGAIAAVLFAAIVPFANEMDVAPATGANAGEPQPEVE